MEQAEAEVIVKLVVSAPNGPLDRLKNLLCSAIDYIEPDEAGVLLNLLSGGGISAGDPQLLKTAATIVSVRNMLVEVLQQSKKE